MARLKAWAQLSWCLAQDAALLVTIIIPVWDLNVHGPFTGVQCEILLTRHSRLYIGQAHLECVHLSTRGTWAAL